MDPYKMRDIDMPATSDWHRGPHIITDVEIYQLLKFVHIIVLLLDV